MTFSEMEARIRSIALRSSSFKIGETGQEDYERLNQHPGKYHRIETITFSKHKREIDYAEEKMIAIFKNWKNCENKRGGSAGRMTNSRRYILYVIYILKK